ncbi:MAG: GntR family transcriptional regulator [Sheuella sp.]|nr:GntR family transcriptional regulator [Sheuella sp.]
MTVAILPESSVGNAGNLADFAYTTIKQKIFDFSFMPGALLSENILSRTVSVSRTPLRQGLQRLQYEGYVIPIPKVGWQVVPVNFAKLDELYDFRLLIETHCVSQLCQSKACHPVIEQMLASWDIDASDMPAVGMAVGALDERFHQQLVTASGNAEIVRTHGEITERIRLVRRLDFTQQNRIVDTFHEHTAILKSILNQDNQLAQDLIRQHVQASKAKVREITLAMLQNARIEY